MHIVDAADVLLLHGDGQAFHRVLKLRYFAFGASQPLFQYALVVGNRLHSFGKSRHIAVQPIHILLEIGCFLCKFIGRNIGSKHDFAALQIPIRRAVLRLDNTCLDNVRHQRAGSDEVCNDLTVRRDGGFVGAVVAVTGKSQAAHIPPPDIHGFVNGGSVQNEQLIGLSVFLAGVDDHIAAALTGDKPGGLADGGLEQLWKASYRGFHLINRGLHLGDGGDHAGLALTEGNALVPLGEGVVHGFNDHSRHTDTQKRVPDGDGIAEIDLLQECRILRLFPERLKGHLHRRDGRTQRICFDVAVGFRSEGFLGHNSVKLVGEIHDERFRPDDLRGHNGERDLRQRDHHFGVRAFRRVYGIREQCGIHAAVVLVLLQGGEVLAVFNDHAGLLPTVRMELYREVVPLKLAVPFGEHGAFRTAEAGTDAFRLRDGKRLCIRVVRPAREACISGKELREDKLRRTALRRKRHHRNIGEVIRDVLTVDGDDAV